MRLLVTGGAGYIGSVVATQLVEAGHQVTVLDDLSTGYGEAVAPGATFVQGTLCGDAERVLAEGAGADGVVHLAAKSLVAESVADPRLYWSHNLGGTLALLEAMRRTASSRIVFSSTAAVYGEPETAPIEEAAPTRPTNPYGASKLAVDTALAEYSRLHGIGAVSLRYFNVAGAYGRCGERHDPETHLIPIVLQVALGQREAVQVYGEDYPTPDGTCIRDFIHVEDIARAHLLAIQALPDGPDAYHRVYNLGNGSGFSVREVIEVARDITGHPIPAAAAPRRPGDPAVLVASSERIRAELGWKPEKPDLKSMVGDAWAFARQG
ncbi:MAG: UDP-glucose 4-epimerase GalE [Streptosporangiales bacterium]|nr:UDP-glucose 4-epimerase GalE [Streptosporangiales bacterium]